jgi:endonuclease/exonuclease/phosphatase family metal-dependent hydrolase
MAPDVLVLEESETSRLSSGGLDVLAYLERELGLRPLTEGGSVAILSRFPVAPGWVAPETPHWTARVALDVDGTVVHVQGVHLARSATERAAQAREILRVANETPFPLVLAGDLNSCPAATCFGGRASDNVHATLAAAYQDAWVLGRAPDDPDGFTHSAANPRRRIDVVLVRGLDVLEAGPVRDEWTLRGSDHLPVKARLVLRDGAPT